MKLLDYFNADYIADLALVENDEGDTQSIKTILQIGNLSQRVEKINDERLINFIFSNHVLMFLDQTISFYLGFAYENFKKNYDFKNQLSGDRILDPEGWLTSSLPIIFKRLENKTYINRNYNNNTHHRSLQIIFKKICRKKLEESACVIIQELEKISTIFGYYDFRKAYISVIAMDQDLRHYLDSNTNEKEFTTTFFQALWMELFKQGLINKDKLYFLNYLQAKNIHSYRYGIPFQQEDIFFDNTISENKEFKNLYEQFIFNKNNNNNYIY
jgi:hypothetical protein